MPRRDVDVATLLATLKESGEWMTAAEIAAVHDASPNIVGFRLQQAASRIEIKPKRGDRPTHYRYLVPPAGNDWFRGWYNPVTGITAPRLG